MSVQYYPGYSQVTVHDIFLVRTIDSITNAYHAVLTTTEDHGYQAGMMVSFLIPDSFGMVELNGQIVQVLEVTSDTLTLDLDTRPFTPFAYPSPLPSAYTPPSVIPNGSGPPLNPPIPYGNENNFIGTTYNNGIGQ